MTQEGVGVVVAGSPVGDAGVMRSLLLELLLLEGALRALKVDRSDATLREEGWRLVLQRTKEAASVIDADNRFVWVNAARVELAGVAEEDLLGKSVVDFYPEQERAATRRLMDQIRAGAVVGRPFLVARAGGEFVPVLTAVMEIGEGCVLTLLCRSEAALGEAAWFAELPTLNAGALVSLPLGESAVGEGFVAWGAGPSGAGGRYWLDISRRSQPTLVADGEGYVRAVNAAMCELLEYSEDELVGKHHMSLNSEQREAEAARSYRTMLSAGGINDVAALRTKSGRETWVEVQGLEMEPGLFLVTLKRQPRGTTPVSAAGWASIFERLPQPMVLFDSEGRLQGVNDAAAALWGADREALMQQRMCEFVPELHGELVAFLERLERHGKRRWEWAVRRADGREVTVEWLAMVVDEGRYLLTVERVLDWPEAPTVLSMFEPRRNGGGNRWGMGPRGTLRWGELEIDLARRRVTRSGGVVPLTPQEYGVLAVLAERAGRVVEAEEIAVAVWGEGDRGSPHLARNVVSRLRRKLEPDPKRPRYIVSASAGGYLFSPGERAD